MKLDRKQITIIGSTIGLVVVAGAIYGLLVYRNRLPDATLPFTQNGSPQLNATEGNTTGIPFKNYGPAPEFTGIEKWLNSEPVKMADLKGQVVLVEFWTYSCRDCITAIPKIAQWYQTYKGKGFTVVSIHTPQYVFERVPENVETAIARFNIPYPVAQDNSYSTWKGFKNQFWPAQYLIDREGKIVYTHFGGDDYDITENAIRQLVGLSGGIDVGPAPDLNANKVKATEIHFGSNYPKVITNTETPSDIEQVYVFPKEKVRANTYALEGTWKLEKDKAIMTQGFGRIRLNFNAGKLYLQASSIKPVTLKIIVDGKTQSMVTIQEAGLYTLFDSDEYKTHTVEIEVPQPGFEATSFTFG